MPTNKPVTQEQIDRMVAAYEAGSNCRQIARDEGLHYVTVGKHLNAEGVRVVPGGPHRKRREFSEGEMTEMISMSQSGASRERIARHFSSSQPVISRVLAVRGEHPVRPGRSGETHASWRGGRTVDAGGYVLVKVASDDPLASMRNRQGYVLEHRLVMARHLGRPLTKQETVHHRNGVRDDNEFENLELRRGAHGKHQAYRCKACGSLDVEPVTMD